LGGNEIEEKMKENSQISTLAIIQAQQLVEQGLPQEALLLLKGELKKNPNSRLVLYHLGLTCRALNDFKEAEEFYLKALTSKDDENVVFPNLKGYQFMGAPEDVIYCQLGIVYQLKEEYEKSIGALETALKLNKDYLNAYNSLAITYRKKGDLNRVIEIYDVGIDRLFHSVCGRMNNVLENKRVGFIGYKTENRLWLNKALEVLLFFVCKDNIEHLSWTTGEQAEKYYASDEDGYGGLLFIDYPESKTRFMLPNYLDTFYESLKSTVDYSFLLNNKARTLAELGRISEARQLLEESIEFIPQGYDFKEPYLALIELDNKLE